VKYSLAPYTGCDHRCLYCYITTYIPRAFQCRLKKDFIKKLTSDLEKADKNIPVTIANSSDPYPTIDAENKLTREMLKLLKEREFKLLLVTKSDLYLRDIDIISSGNIAVTETINTNDDSLAQQLEPGAPVPSKRISAMEKLIEHDIPVMVRVDPLIPGLNEDVGPLLKELSNIGVKYITTSTYKARPDSLKRLSLAFPIQASKWKKLYMDQGEFINRSWYLERLYREKLMKDVSRNAKRFGLKFHMCREGLGIERSGLSCDGAHLLNR
jgi:DNA repair photolyase